MRLGVRGTAGSAGLSLGGGGATQTNVHRDALCFMAKTWARHKTTEALLNNGWRLVAVGGWRFLAVGSFWLVAVGGWRLAVGGPWGLALRAVLSIKQRGFFRTAVGLGRDGAGAGAALHDTANA